MAIEFYCPGCGHLMRTPDETAGRKGRCPHCGIKVQIPPSTLVGTANNPGTESLDDPGDRWKEEPAESKIEFYCSSCGRQVRVAGSAAGQKGQCPHCQAVMRIPSDED